MYNLRYHIASLVALFLALALGLVLGGLVVERGAISRQQANLVKNLQEEFAALRAENQALARDGKLADDLAGALTDRWAQGRLDGKTIVVLTNAGRASGVEQTRDVVESAGGAVASVIVLKPGFGLDDEAVRSAVETLIAAPNDELLDSVCASLAAEWAGPGPDRPVTEALTEAGVLRLDGMKPGVSAAGLVDLAMEERKPEEAAVCVAVWFKTYGPAVCAQMSGEETGIAAAGDEAGVAAIDTLGTTLGRYTLVALLTGAKSGYYGTGQGAVSAFPDVPEP